MESEIYHVDKNGNTVDATSAGVAFQVNPSDPGAQKFVDALKDPNAVPKGPVSAGDINVPVQDLGATSDTTKKPEDLKPRK